MYYNPQNWKISMPNNNATATIPIMVHFGNNRSIRRVKNGGRYYKGGIPYRILIEKDTDIADVIEKNDLFKRIQRYLPVLIYRQINEEDAVQTKTEIEMKYDALDRSYKSSEEYTSLSDIELTNDRNSMRIDLIHWSYKPVDDDIIVVDVNCILEHKYMNNRKKYYSHTAYFTDFSDSSELMTSL